MILICFFLVFNIIILTRAANLVVYDQSFNVTKIFFSSFLDVLSNNDALSHGLLIANITNTTFELPSLISNKSSASFVWKDWNDCHECGEDSIQMRSGSCKLKGLNSDCSSLKTNLNHSIFFENLTQYRNCFRECNQTDFDELNGYTNEMLLLNDTEENAIITRVEAFKGDTIKLLCLDRKFEAIKWTKNKRKISRKSTMLQLSAKMARVYVNSFDEVEILNVRYADTGEYLCLVDNKEIVKIHFVVKKKFFVDKVSLYGSYTSITLVLLIYMSLVSCILVCESVRRMWTGGEKVKARVSQERENKNMKRFIRENIQKYNEEFEKFLLVRNLE